VNEGGSRFDYATAIALITAWNDDDPDGAGAWVSITNSLSTIDDWERVGMALANLAVVFADRAADAEGITSAEVIRDVATVAAWQQSDRDESG